MKNYSKRQRTVKSYRDTDKGKYSSSKNSENLRKIQFYKKLTLEQVQDRINFLKKYRPQDKCLIQKCQNLIDSKTKQQ